MKNDVINIKEVVDKFVFFSNKYGLTSFKFTYKKGSSLSLYVIDK